MALRLCTCTTTGLLGTSLSRQHFAMLIGECPPLLILFPMFVVIIFRICITQELDWKIFFFLFFPFFISGFVNYFLIISFYNLTNAVTCFRKHLSSNLFFLYIFGKAVIGPLFFLEIELSELMLNCLVLPHSCNRKACWRRGRKLCFVALLHSYWCWSKSCFLVDFTKRYSLCWSFWCCFWAIYY